MLMGEEDEKQQLRELKMAVRELREHLAELSCGAQLLKAD